MYREVYDSDSSKVVIFLDEYTMVSTLLSNSVKVKLPH